MYLFRTEMDAEEYINCQPNPANLVCDGPVNPDKAIATLKHISSIGLSHVVINPPPNHNKPPTLTSIEEVINHLKKKGHIRDLAV
jgi:hypothetical protein